jgi:transposase
MVKVKEFNKDPRKIVVEHHKDGKSVSEIVKYLANQVSSRTIYRWIDEYKENGKMHIY